jgi:hypothetical protein
LRALRQAAEEAQDALARAKVEHAAAVAKDRAEIAASQAALNKREISLRAREASFESTRELVAAQQAYFDPAAGRYEKVGGITREFVPGYARDDTGAAHEKTAVDSQFEPGAADTRIERVPGVPPNATLRHTVQRRPRPRARAEL